MRGSPVQRWEIEEYARRVADGATLAEIARERGITMKGVRLWVRKGREGARGGFYTPLSDAWEARLAAGNADRERRMRLLAEGLAAGRSLTKVAEDLGVSKMTAKRWAKSLALRHSSPSDEPVSQRPCRLYVVGAWLDGRLLFVKVGRTVRDPRRRLEAMRTGSPLRLTMLRYWWGTYADEGRLHRELRPHRARREWFHARPEVLAALDIPDPQRPSPGRPPPKRTPMAARGTAERAK